MAKFICHNPECSNNGIVEHYTRISYKWNVSTMRLEAEESFCPVCGEFRHPEKEYEGFTEAWFKAESNRNYDNKKVKQYDYDHNVAKEQVLEIK